MPFSPFLSEFDITMVVRRAYGHARLYCLGLGYAVMPRHGARPSSQPSPTSLPVTSSMMSFVGCVRNVHVTYDVSPWPGLQLYRASGVERGCRDLCATSTSRCANSGRCINDYVTATCDCFGTGFEGPRCQSTGLS